jgi:hypothetical protein
MFAHGAVALPLLGHVGHDDFPRHTGAAVHVQVEHPGVMEGGARRPSTYVARGSYGALVSQAIRRKARIGNAHPDSDVRGARAATVQFHLPRVTGDGELSRPIRADGTIVEHEPRRRLRRLSRTHGHTAVAAAGLSVAGAVASDRLAELTTAETWAACVPVAITSTELTVTPSLAE